MNFLAHLYLSGTDPEIRLGNFIGDYVKGKRFDNFPDQVQVGIKLHRAIDSFTDKHGSTRCCNELLRVEYGKYAGVVVDVLYDHVLANEWKKYSGTELKPFTRSFYLQMVRRYTLLPDPVKKFLPFMIQSNRLYSYKTTEGLKKAIDIMSSVTSLPDKSNGALKILEVNRNQIFQQFNTLFPELIDFVQNEYGIKLR